MNIGTYVSEHVRHYVFDKSSLEILHFGIKPRFTALKIILFTFNTSDGVGFLDSFRHTRPLLLLFTTIILYSSPFNRQRGGNTFHIHHTFTPVILKVNMYLMNRERFWVLVLVNRWHGNPPPIS